MEGRWEKGDKFVEIELGLSADRDGEHVYSVETNAFENLVRPSGWADLIPRSDHDRVQEVFNSVSQWAEKNEFKRVKSRKGS